MIQPFTLTFLTTYRCTAACSECCFGCSPIVQSPQMSFFEIKEIIDEAKATFSKLKVVVFSGGECFLFGDELYKSIEYASKKGLSTRCVTNGFWEKSKLC